MKIRELFEEESIDAEFIENNFDGSYWENCDSFIIKNWEREYDGMSEKQTVWIDKILEDCIEKRIEG